CPPPVADSPHPGGLGRALLDNPMALGRAPDPLSKPGQRPKTRVCRGNTYLHLSSCPKMPPTCLITGATGFVGGHLAQASVRRSWTARALARAGSDTGLLERNGVAVARGDLTDTAAVRTALQGVEVVFHCAAKVGDWGPVEDYRAVNVEGLRGLLE